MKKTGILLGVLLGVMGVLMLALAPAPNEQVHMFPVATYADTGTYFLGTEDSAGFFTTKRWNYGLNTALSANPNTNQGIYIGEANIYASNPYGGVNLGLNPLDSGGYLFIGDTASIAHLTLISSAGHFYSYQYGSGGNINTSENQIQITGGTVPLIMNGYSLYASITGNGVDSLPQGIGGTLALLGQLNDTAQILRGLLGTPTLQEVCAAGNTYTEWAQFGAVRFGSGSNYVNVGYSGTSQYAFSWPNDIGVGALVADGTGSSVWQAVTTPVNSIILYGQTSSTTVTTYPVTGTGNFDITGHITLTTFGTGTASVSVSYTDENNNPQTLPLASVTGTAAGPVTYTPTNISAYDGTTITISTMITLSVGTAVYSVAANILKQ